MDGNCKGERKVLLWKMERFSVAFSRTKISRSLPKHVSSGSQFNLFVHLLIVSVGLDLCWSLSSLPLFLLKWLHAIYLLLNGILLSILLCQWHARFLPLKQSFLDVLYAKCIVSIPPEISGLESFSFTARLFPCDHWEWGWTFNQATLARPLETSRGARHPVCLLQHSSYNLQA